MQALELGDLYRAYRKAKTDAFYDRGHFHSIAFVKYEADLEKNLSRLLSILTKSDAWANDVGLLGGVSYLPKGIEAPMKSHSRDIHFATLDPVQDWVSACRLHGKQLQSSFRPIIVPTVDYQVISALWVMKVGQKFDAKIDRNLVYAHKLKRVGRRGAVNTDSHQLYEPYFSGYRAWRSDGLKSIRNALNQRQSVVAVTMDVQSFYHSVSAEFLLRKSFLRHLGLELNEWETFFTQALIKSFATWYKSTPEFKDRPEGALPVGLSASKLISNVLLDEFDRVVAAHEQTVHYGRYADDVFLVMQHDSSIRTGEDFVRWLRKQFEGYLVLAQDAAGTGLRLKLGYAANSDIVFSAKKQKIFFLSGVHGLDLVGQIEEQIRKQSSEHRLLPELPENDAEMLDLALLATPDARLEADALRKAEAVSLRRLGFSFLLGDFEAYARDVDHLDPNWQESRLRFYGIVNRYVITPVGFFDYFTYIVRVFGLMISCRDFGSAVELLNHLDRVSSVILETTDAGWKRIRAYTLARNSYYRGFLQAMLESATVSGFLLTAQYLKLLRKVASEASVKLGTHHQIEALVERFLLSDLGRRSYQEFWYVENRVEASQPPLPSSVSVKKVLAKVREYRDKARKLLNPPYWPAVAFPTRPPLPWQLSLSIPRVLEEPGEFENLIRAVRGGFVNPSHRDYSFMDLDEDGRHVWRVPIENCSSPCIAIPSIAVADKQWEGALNGKPDHSLGRYLGLRKLVNAMIRSKAELDYVVFPELSIPYLWALDIAIRLSRAGISLIAGVENRGRDGEYKNDVLVSLVTDFYGRRGNVCFLQSKIAPSHDEAWLIKDAKKRFSLPTTAVELEKRRPIYQHGNFSFGLLVCSDLTTIQNRSRFQGAIDALFVIEWNKDTETFNFLVESAAHDLHAAIVQVNNRRFGDSRLRLPFSEGYRRDVVKVKGGDEDFFVFSKIDVNELRAFQLHSRRPLKPEVPAKRPTYKPVPVGFKMSANRRKPNVK